MHTGYNLGTADRIPVGEGRQFVVGDLEIAVFRSRENKVFALQADCPHKGGPLADGLLGSGRVVCPLHGYAFEIETGRPLGHGCEALRTYPIEINHRGEMILDLERAVADPVAHVEIG